MSEFRLLSSIFIVAAAPLVLLSACSSSSDPGIASEGQVSSTVASEGGDTAAASESCVDIGKPNPSLAEVNDAQLESWNRELVAAGGSPVTEVPGNNPAATQELLLSVPEGGFSDFASAVCNKPIEPSYKLSGPPAQDLRGLAIGAIPICEGFRGGIWNTVPEMKKYMVPMFASHDPESVPEGDPTGATYGQYRENVDNFSQAAVDYICPQYK